MTRRLGPPPIEQLDDLTWARVEKQVMSALDQQATIPAATPSPVRRSWRPFAMVAGGVILAAAIVLLVPWRPSGNGPHHELPSRITTASASSTVSFGDAEITVAPESALVLGGSQGSGVDLVLERGSAEFAVAPRNGRPPFVVHAGAADVRVIGTRFMVTRSGDAARVVVAHGEVEVVAHGRREVLLAGDSWDSSREREAATRSSATVPNPGDVAAARLSLPPADAGVAETPHRVPPPAPPVASAPPVDLRAEFEAATALEATDPAAALEAYRKLSRAKGPWAANALYAAARLAMDRGDAASALKLARSYLARFPGGSNAADATALVDRIQHDQGAP